MNLIMLPGMMCDQRLFSAQIEAVQSQGVDVWVAPISGYDSIKALAEAVLTDAPDRFALLGLSMGGIVAMEILRQAPKRMLGIALLDTNPFAELPEVAARRATQMEAVKNGELEALMRTAFIPNYFSDTDTPQTQKLIQICIDMAIDLGAEAFIRQSKALRDRIDQCRSLAEAEQPALVLMGRDDQLCPIDRHQKMAELLREAELCVIEEAGHLPTIEQPQQCNEAILKWLNRI